MTFQDILARYRAVSFSERDTGDRFERLMQAFLQTVPWYAGTFRHVWLWREFPYKQNLGGKIKSLLSLVVIAALLFFSVQPAIAGATEDILALCPRLMVRPAYHDIAKTFAYRLKDAVGTHGCDAVPVYYAFGTEEGAALLDTLEKSSELMKIMIDLLRQRLELAEQLRSNTNLVLSLTNYISDEEALSAYIATLKKLVGQRENIHTVMVSLLIPGIPSQRLTQIFTPKEIAILLPVLRASAIGSDENYAPFLADYPSNSCMVYKQFMKEWGLEDLQSVVSRTPYAISSLKPPMTWREIAAFFPSGSYPDEEKFQDMQRRYMYIQHNLYMLTSKQYGEAWAAEVCMAFADSMLQAIWQATAEEESHILSFFSWLIEDSLFFRSIVMPTACYEQSNINLLGALLAYPEKNYLGCLADWHATGNLSGLLDLWAATTTAKGFANLATDSGRKSADAVYLGSMLELARLRTTLSEQQKKLLDYLLYSIPFAGDQPWVTPAFLLSVGKTLFSVMQDGKFNDPQAVARHLLQFGYPDSSSLSLYECFRSGQPAGCPEADWALRERGRLPEAELLASGRTFRDITGVDLVTVIDVADVAVTILSSIANPPAIVPNTLAAFARMAARRFAVQLAKSMARKGGGALGRNIVGNGVKRLIQTERSNKLSRNARKFPQKPRLPRGKGPNERDDSSEEILEEIIDNLEHFCDLNNECNKRILPALVWRDVLTLCPEEVNCDGNE